MDGTILGQGSFVVPATIVNQIIQIPSNADFMWVKNYTQLGTNGAVAPRGVTYYWQRGMAAGTGIVEYKTNAGAGLNVDTLLTGGFTLYDPSGQSLSAGAQPNLGPAVATTATTNATRPVVSTGNTAGVSVGSVVRMNSTAQSDVNGVDMVVSAVTPNVSFTLLFASNALANVPGAIGGAGFYRLVNADSIYYPRHRFITDISQAVNAVVDTSVAHGLTPGQKVRFSIPSLSPAPQTMVELDGLQATILTVPDDFSFTIDIDTTAMTAFSYPAIAQEPVSPPLVIPFGEDTGKSLSIGGNQTPEVGGIQIFNTNSGILADSTVNTYFLGMILGTGGNGAALGAAITGPAGSVAADVMFWVAGKSTYGGL